MNLCPFCDFITRVWPISAKSNSLPQYPSPNNLTQTLYNSQIKETRKNAVQNFLAHKLLPNRMLNTTRSKYLKKKKECVLLLLAPKCFSLKLFPRCIIKSSERGKLYAAKLVQLFRPEFSSHHLYFTFPLLFSRVRRQSLAIAIVI